MLTCHIYETSVPIYAYVLMLTLTETRVHGRVATTASMCPPWHVSGRNPPEAVTRVTAELSQLTSPAAWHGGDVQFVSLDWCRYQTSVSGLVASFASIRTMSATSSSCQHTTVIVGHFLAIPFIPTMCISLMLISCCLLLKKLCWMLLYINISYRFNFNDNISELSEENLTFHNWPQD